MAWAASGTPGTGNSKVSSTTVATSAAVGASAGDILFAHMVWDGTTALLPDVTGLNKPAGETNSWVKVTGSRSSVGASAGGVHSDLWMIQATTAWNTVVTATLSAATVAKTIVVRPMSGGTTELRTGKGVGIPSGAATQYLSNVWKDDLFLLGLAAESTTAGTGAPTGITISGSNAAATTGGGAAANAAGWLGWGIAPTDLGFNGISNYQASIDGGQILAAFVPDPGPNATVTQDAFQFYADGNENDSVALASQDTGIDATPGADLSFHLRMRLQATGPNAVHYADDWQLQYEKNASGTWTDVGMILDPTPIDRYDISNNATGIGLTVGDLTRSEGQSFMGDGRPIGAVRWWLSRVGSLLLDCVVNTDIHLDNGAGYGTAGRPLNQRAGLSTRSFKGFKLPTNGAPEPVTFPFDGTFTLAGGTPLFITITPAGSVSPSDYFLVANDNSSPTHPGSRIYRATSWSTVNSSDMIFEVLAGTRTSVGPFASKFIAPDAYTYALIPPTTNRLTGGSGTFVPGAIAMGGIAEALGWASGDFTELLYTLTLRGTDFANGDTLRFRVARNGATTGMTYTQTPTINIGTAIPAIPHAKTDNLGLTDSMTYAVVRPKTETLTDDFAFDDTTKWPNGNRYNTVFIRNGRVEATELTSPPRYSGVCTDQIFTLMDSSVSVKMTRPSVQTASTETTLTVRDSSAQNSASVILYYDPAQVGVENQVCMRLTVATVYNNAWVDYNPTTMAYWRVRQSGGNYYWDSSPDGQTWTNRRTLAHALVLNLVGIELSVGQWAAGEPTQSTGYFDNVNLVGGQEFTHAKTDNLGITDAQTDGITLNRSDTLGVTDAQTDVITLNRSDNLGATDAQTDVITINRSDSLGITDAQTDVIPLNRSDGLGLTDAGFTHVLEASNPKASTLTDDFSGDLSKWPGSYGGVVIEAGRAKIPVTASYPSLWTNPVAYNMESSSFFAQITTPAPGLNREFSMEARLNNDNKAIFLHAGGWLYFNTYTATVGTTHGSMPYNAVDDAWWKLHSTGPGNIRFSTSRDGFSWTERASATVAWSLTATQLLFMGGVWGAGSPDDVAYADNVNVPGVPPIPVTGLSSWFDADDSTSLTLAGSDVTAWRDGSANSYVLTQVGSTAPKSGTRTIGGRNALDFTNGGMQKAIAPINNPVDGSWTLFCVAELDTVAPNPQHVIDGDGGPRVAQYIRMSGANIAVIGFGSGGAVADIGPQTVAGAARILRTSCTGTALETFVNGATEGATAVVDQAYSASSPLTIGVHTDQSTGPTDGAIGEVIAYSRALAPAEITQVENYLTDKWMPGQALTLDKSDTLGLADSQTDGITLARSDAEAVTDAQTDVIGLARSDTLAPTDAQTDVIGLARSDTLAPTDTQTDVIGANQADSLGLTDSMTYSLGTALDRADAVALTDYFIGDKTSANALDKTDNLGLTDSVTSAANYVQDRSKTLNLTDSVSTALAAVSAFADNLGVTDSVTYTIGRGLDRTDLQGITDSQTDDITLARTDTLGMTETFSGDKTSAGAVSTADNMGLADYQTDVIGTDRSDSAGPTDSLTAAAGRVQAYADLAPLTDSITFGVGRTADTADLLGLTDPWAFTFPVISRAETLNLTDSLTFSKSTAGAQDVTDLVGLTDGWSLLGQYVRPQSDTLGLTDSWSIAVTRTLNLADTIGLTDTRVFALSMGITDTTGLLDTSARTATLTRTDLVKPSDSMTSLKFQGGRPKIELGSGFVPKPGRVWTGAGWPEKPWKQWDGTQWKLVR